MSSVLKFLNSLPVVTDEEDVTGNLNYMKKSSLLIGDALQKGLDVLQLASGDIEVTEVKTITYKYLWDAHHNRFTRASTGAKQVKRGRKRRSEKMPAPELEQMMA